jgi:large subunit ribosomal protein L24
MNANKDRTKKTIRYTKSNLKPREKSDRIVASEAWLRGRHNLRRQWNVKLGDEVMVLSGKDKGKTGKVLRVFPQKGQVVVEGVNLVKRHQRQRNQSEGEIVEKPAPLWIWKVALFVEIDGKPKPTRVRIRDGKRVAVRNGEVLD